MPAQITPEITPEIVQAVTEALRNMAAVYAQVFTTIAEGIGSAVHALQSANLAPSPEPDHPLARMNARRQNQAHGPQRQPRPPRQLGPGGR